MIKTLQLLLFPGVLKRADLTELSHLKCRETDPMSQYPHADLEIHLLHCEQPLTTRVSMQSDHRTGGQAMLFQADPNGGILSDQSGQNTMEYLVIGTILIAAVIVVAGVLAQLIQSKAASIGW